MKPTTVEVHDSGSPMFPYKDEIYSFEDFERLALSSCTLFPGTEEEPNCTNVTVTFANGDQMEAHLDLVGAYDGDWGIQDYLSTVRIKLEARNDIPEKALEFIRSLEMVSH